MPTKRYSRAKATTDVEVPGGDHMTVIARRPDNMKKVFDFFDQNRRRRP